MRTAPERLLLRLEWRVLRRLDGRLQGGYRTVYRGSGTDFTGLRAYLPGDDARHIDWNVTARLSEPHLRVYTEDRLLDESLAFGDGDCVLVPRGYHTVSAPPGYDIYYLNVMAGPARLWVVANDPDHAWTLDP